MTQRSLRVAASTFVVVAGEEDIRKRRMRNLTLVQAFAGRTIVLHTPLGRHSLEG